LSQNLRQLGLPALLPAARWQYVCLLFSHSTQTVGTVTNR
jgi:hypothetical protein